MRIVTSDFMSLDGVVQAPGGAQEDTDGGFAHGGWSMPYFDPDTMGPAIGEVMESAEALLFGRRTWQTMAAAWPGRAGDPFADQMNAIPKFVVSRTLSPGRSLLVELDVAGIRRRPGGSARVADGRRWRSPRHGKFLACQDARRERSRGRVPPHDRARHARRRQAPVPRRRPVAADGTGLYHDQQHGCPHLQVPTEAVVAVPGRIRASSTIIGCTPLSEVRRSHA